MMPKHTPHSAPSFVSPAPLTLGRVASRTLGRVASRTLSRVASRTLGRVASRTLGRVASRTLSRVVSRTLSRIMVLFLCIFILQGVSLGTAFGAVSSAGGVTSLDMAVDTVERFFYKNYKQYRVNTRTKLLDTPFYTTNITIKNNAISQVVDFYTTDKYIAMHMFYTKSGVRATRYNQLNSVHGTKPYSTHEVIKFVNNFLTLKLSPLLRFQSRIIEPIAGLDGFYLLEVQEYYNQQLMQSYTLVSNGDVVTFDLISIGNGIEYGDFYQYHHPSQTLQALDYSNYERIYGTGNGANKMLIIADLDNTYTEMIIRNYLPLFEGIPSIDVYFLPFPQKSRYIKSQLLTNIFSVSRIMGDDFMQELASRNISQYNSSSIADYFASISSNRDQFNALLQSERIKLAYDNIVFQNLFLGLDVTPWVVYNGNIVKGYNEAMFLYIISQK